MANDNEKNFLWAVLPILVLLFFVRLVKMLFSVNINFPIKEDNLLQLISRKEKVD